MSSIFLPAIALQPFLFLPLAFIAGEKPKLSQQKPAGLGNVRLRLPPRRRLGLSFDVSLSLKSRGGRLTAALKKG